MDVHLRENTLVTLYSDFMSKVEFPNNSSIAHQLYFLVNNPSSKEEKTTKKLLAEEEAA